MSDKKFDGVDFAVLFTFLAVSASIGLYYRCSGGKQKTTLEYLFGDKTQRIVPVAVSLIASMMSSITLLGVSAEIYLHSTQFVLINLGYILVTPIIAYFYLPVYFKLQATSIFEYLERRFGSKMRFTVSSVYFFQTVLYMGVVLYAPALTLEALTGISSSSSLFITGFVCTFYSALGGMKAVITTDLFQSMLMFMAVFIVIFTAAYEKGFGRIWTIAKEHDRLQFFNFDLDPTTRHSFWSLVIGGGWTYLSLCTVNQTQVQRYMTLCDLKSAVLTLFISLPIIICLSLSTSFSGLAIFSKYYDCDPIESKRIARGDQLMPLYVLDVVGGIPGLTGFFVSGIFSAGLSTVSAILNSLAAITLEDYIKPVYLLLYKKPYPSERVIHMTKALVLVFGGLCLAVAFLAKFLGGVLQASLTILGVVGGPVLGVFTLGMFVPFANQLGGLSSLILSLFALILLAFGGPKPPVTPLPLSVAACNNSISNNSVAFLSGTVASNGTHQLSMVANSVLPSATSPVPVYYPYLYRISYLWYVVIGFIMTMFIGTVVSLCTYKFYGESTTKLDPDLFTPPVANYLKRQRKKIIQKHVPEEQAGSICLSNYVKHDVDGDNCKKQEEVQLL